MIECRVESIRGKNIQRKITIRNCFDWTVKSLQTFSTTGIIADHTITQIVYERQHDYAHRAELEPLEKEADKLVFPNLKPTTKKLTAMIILSVIFGGIWFAIPYVIAALQPLLSGVDLTPIRELLGWIFLGLTGVFAIWILPLIITAIVKKVKLKKNTKKMEAIIAAATKIHTTPAPSIHPSQHPVASQPVVPVVHNELPKMPKTEKPLVRPFVKPAVQPAAPVVQPAAPAVQPVVPATPVAPSPVVEAPVTPVAPVIPEKPIE